MNTSFWNQFSSDYTANCRAWHHFPGNPILPPTGHGWKRRWTANPDFLTFQGKTFLYYRGNGTLGTEPGERVHDRIGVGIVEEIGPGILRLNNDAVEGKFVIDVGEEGSFDGGNVLDPAAIVFQNQVWLYYTRDSPTNQGSVGLAVSEDGVHFTKMGAVLTGRSPDLALRDGMLYMLYQKMGSTGKYTLHLATSTDGIHFTPTETEVIYPRAPGQWDSFSITTSRLYEPGDGWYYLFYGGSAYLADEPDYFGLARSQDLIQWEPHPGNPIFGAGAKGEPDGGAIWFPALYETEDQFVLLYEGSRGKYSWDLHSTICMAWLDKK